MSSSGATAQLALRGMMDSYLQAPNEFTFWKTNYRRHTNFSMTEIEVPFCNTAGYGRNKITSKIGRNGDLLAQMYLHVVIDRIQYTDAGASYNPAASPPAYAYYTNSLGHALIREVSINVGNTEFDKHYGEYLELLEILMAPSDRQNRELISRWSSELEQSYASQNDQTLYIPMKFWFNRFYEQALPMISLYWHDVDLYLSTRPLSELWGVSGAAAGNITVPTDPSTMQLICNYVYLDRPERTAFANNPHEYVYDEVQYLGEEPHSATQSSQRLNIRYNHPVQELIWVCQRDAVLANNEWFNFTGPSTGAPEVFPRDPFTTAQIFLNNNERTIQHPSIYYRLVQPLQHHNRLPDSFVYNYSFALHPEELQSSGSANFSRYDNASLNITFPTGTVAFPDNPTDPVQTVGWDGRTRIYARNKNVMKLVSGMAGKKFAA